MSSRRSTALQIAGVIAIVVILVVAGITISLGHTRNLPVVPAAPIDHFVFVVMENHPFDNYFGAYCPAVTALCPDAVNGLPPDLCVPNNNGSLNLGCVRPYNFTAAQRDGLPDMAHTWQASHVAYDNGRMDGFYLGENNTTEPFGHFNGSTIPTYWDLAEQFGLADNFYSSELSFSLPNHWHIVAAQAPAILNTNRDFLHNASTAHTYLNEANQTRSIQDLLLNSTVSWKYYDFALGNYSTAIQSLSPYHAFDLWNPLAARAESYNRSFNDHFTNTSAFFQDVQAGQLPNVSWVIPQSPESDHPPDNLTMGETFVASVVDSIEYSPYWNTTAVFVYWDDYGGFYDHVSPPPLSSVGLGFRVPLLVVSPYTDRGYVGHSLIYFESLLHLIEERFGLGCLTGDCTATLPLEFFDFDRAPRPPVLFPTNSTTATYPMPLSPTKASFSGVPPSAARDYPPPDEELAD